MLDCCLKNWTVIGLCKFLGNEKDPNYRIIVGTMLGNFQQLGRRMSIKVRKIFPASSGAVSYEQGDDQDIKTIETRYQGQYDCSMMADYCWSSKHDCHR